MDIILSDLVSERFQVEDEDFKAIMTEDCTIL